MEEMICSESCESNAMSDGTDRNRGVGDWRVCLTANIKQEETGDATIHCSSASDSALLCAKQEGSTIKMLNKSVRGKPNLDTALDVYRHLAHISDIAVLPFRVKEEPASDDEENWEQKGNHTGGDPLGLEIKQEITSEHTDLVEEEVNLKEETEDRGSEMDEGNTSAFYDNSAVVKSENGVPDTDINEEDSMSDAAWDMDKQKEDCSRDGSKRQIFHKYMKKFCHATKAGYTCFICGKNFSKSQGCLSHIWHMHTSDKPHVCKLCGKSFKSMFELISHKATHFPYSCDICGNSFKKVGQLDRHKTYHSNERCYSCDVCGKTFKSRSNLNSHRERHSNERSHSCDLCQKGFKTKADLQQHIYLCHSDEKPFSCDECGESFKRIVQLDKHKTYHTNEGPYSYSCDLCEKDFTAKGNLKQHIYFCHSDRRPYACDECGSSFKRKASLKRHKEKSCHKKKRPISCNGSGTIFNQLNEQTKLSEEGNENAVISADSTKIFFTYSKLTNLHIKQELKE